MGFLALTTAAPFPKNIVQCDQHEQGTSGDDEQGHEETIKAFEAINSTAQISLNHEYLLLGVLPSFDVEEDEEVSSDQKSFSIGNKALKILFRRIISPNAP